MAEATGRVLDIGFVVSTPNTVIFSSSSHGTVLGSEHDLLKKPMDLCLGFRLTHEQTYLPRSFPLACLT